MSHNMKLKTEIELEVDVDGSTIKESGSRYDTIYFDSIMGNLNLPDGTYSIKITVEKL